MQQQVKSFSNIFRRVTNIAPCNHPALQVKGRDLLIGSNESYMPERIQGYNGEFPPAFEYKPTEAQNGQERKVFAKTLHDFLQSELKTHGCVIIKNAPLAGQEDFASMMEETSFGLTKYVGGTTFRDEEEKNVYTPTNENPGITMESHWDQPYWAQPPKKLAFYYEEPAEDGVNNLLDGRKFYQSLDKEIVDKFEKLQVRYEHYYPDQDNNNRFVSWQRSFGKDKSKVEGWLKENGYEFEWVKNGKDLRKWEVSPAIKLHPQTQEKCWQNNISGHHGSYFHNHFLFPELKNRDFTDPNKFKGLDFDYYPHHTKYGDGTEIDYEIIKYLREQLWKKCVGVMAEKGDLVVVDNYLAGHGRLGFTPPRKAFISIITS